ncbi:MAG: hypothetical protein JOZ32_02480 [Bryobacterales bacterium]|nr:hypothetical protein [Bryobacterales bacterium]
MEQLFGLVAHLHFALTKAGIEYRVIGGMAVFLQVSARDPDAARFTRDVDIAVDRTDLERISKAAEDFAFRHRHVGGLDMLVSAEDPKARSAVHLVFVREKVQPGDLQAIPDFSEPTRTVEGFLIAPVQDLVRMKLTSFRMKDKTHIIDMDSVGLITQEIEAALSEPLRRRLHQVRAQEAESTGRD